eukprot:TRINITY_DN403_c0_g1_i2.p1 TRINITY_DN403_c0_g1~~TRINITY_DN403_c0_g1_i2.p1  ORF type:complete len:604 (-),score=68.60 TRINITY_DN403_c0_g1_i2:379-2190(-)
MAETRSARGCLLPNRSQESFMPCEEACPMDIPRRRMTEVSMHMRSSQRMRRSLTARGMRTSCRADGRGRSKSCSSPNLDSADTIDVRVSCESVAGLPRRKVTEFSVHMQKGDRVRESLSHSPVRSEEQQKPATSLRCSLTARHERTGVGTVLVGDREQRDCVALGSVAGLPRRKVTEFSECMQKGDSVRESLSHSPVRAQQWKPAASLRRSLTACHLRTEVETVLTGHGERCSTPRRCLQLSRDGMTFAKRNRASGGIPWRQLPIYTSKGHITQTTDCSQLVFSPSSGKARGANAHWQTSGAAAKDLLMLSERTQGYSLQTTSSAAGLSISPGRVLADALGSLPVSSTDTIETFKPEHCLTMNTARRVGHISRSAAVALSAAARASNVAAEAERSRCLAKFDRLCHQTPRTGSFPLANSTSGNCCGDRPGTQVSQKPFEKGASYVADSCPFAQSDSLPAQLERPLCRQIAHFMPSNVLGQTEDVPKGRLVAAETVAEASRTWQFKQDLAKRCDISAHALASDKQQIAATVVKSASYSSALARRIASRVKKSDALCLQYPCLLSSAREPDPEMGAVARKISIHAKNTARTESTATPKSTGNERD